MTFPYFPASAGKYCIHPPKLCASIIGHDGIACTERGNGASALLEVRIRGNGIRLFLLQSHVLSMIYDKRRIEVVKPELRHLGARGFIGLWKKARRWRLAPQLSYPPLIRGDGIMMPLRPRPQSV